MMLNGSHIDPGLVDNPLGQEDANEGANRKQQQAIEAALSVWSSFHDTDQGQTCAALAEPKVKQLDAMIATPTHDLMKKYGFPLEAIQELRAEWRGARGVWYEIMYAAKQFRAQLETMEGKEAIPEKPTWRTMTSRSRKTLTKQPNVG